MVCSVSYSFVVLLPLLGLVSALQEDMFKDHEVSESQARNATIPFYRTEGCGVCSRRDEVYCLGNDLINDHCCCDGRHDEQIPYVPHACYRGANRCLPVAPDCGEYARLLECCCHKLLIARRNSPTSYLYTIPGHSPSASTKSSSAISSIHPYIKLILIFTLLTNQLNITL